MRNSSSACLAASRAAANACLSDSFSAACTGVGSAESFCSSETSSASASTLSTAMAAESFSNLAASERALSSWAMIRPTRSALAASSASCCCNSASADLTLTSASVEASFAVSRVSERTSIALANSVSLRFAASRSAESSSFDGAFEPPPRTKDLETRSPSIVMMVLSDNSFESSALLAAARSAAIQNGSRTFRTASGALTREPAETTPAISAFAPETAVPSETKNSARPKPSERR